MVPLLAEGQQAVTRSRRPSLPAGGRKTGAGDRFASTAKHRSRPPAKKQGAQERTLMNIKKTVVATVCSLMPMLGLSADLYGDCLLEHKGAIFAVYGDAPVLTTAPDQAGAHPHARRRRDPRHHGRRRDQAGRRPALDPAPHRQGR